MNKKIILFFFILFSQILLSCETKNKEDVSLSIQDSIKAFPKQIGLLNDFESIFTVEQKQELKNILSDFKAIKGKQVIIVSVEAYQPYNDFKEFTVDLGNDWKLSYAVLIVFSKEKRKIALSITDDVTDLSGTEGQRIVSEMIIPSFKDDNYYEGIKKGVQEFIAKWH